MHRLLACFQQWISVKCTEADPSDTGITLTCCDARYKPKMCLDGLMRLCWTLWWCNSSTGVINTWTSLLSLTRSYIYCLDLFKPIFLNISIFCLTFIIMSITFRLRLRLVTCGPMWRILCLSDLHEHLYTKMGGRRHSIYQPVVCLVSY